MKKKNVWIPIIVFLTLIFGGMIWGFVTPDQSYSDTENRFLAKMPEFSVKAVFERKFTTGYEDYITDQFPARDQWIGFKTQIEKLLGKVETKNVWLAEEDYLVVNHAATDFTGEQAQKNAAALKDALAYYVDRLGQDHVRVLLVPTASQILTEKLPDYAPAYDQNLFLTMMQDTAAQAVGECVAEQVFVSAEAALKPHADEYIFYRTDHHWTTLGAFYAYQSWAAGLGLEPLSDSKLKVVSENFEGTTYSKVHYAGKQDILSVYDTAKDVTMIHNQSKESSGFYDWSALEKRDQYALFLGGNDSLVEIFPADGQSAVIVGQNGLAMPNKTGAIDPEEKVLMVVKDSFANCFIPYTAEHFDRVIVVDLRFLNMGLKQVAELYGVTDLLVLYNVQAFATDNTVYKISR